MEKALVQIIFGRIFFICQPIFKFFVALFKTLGMQKDDKITFFPGGVSDQGDTFLCKKAVSKGWCKESR